MARSISSRNWSSDGGGGPELLLLDPPQDILIIAMFSQPMFSRGDTSIVLPNRASHSRRLRRVVGAGKLMNMTPEASGYGRDYTLTVRLTRSAGDCITSLQCRPDH